MFYFPLLCGWILYRQTFCILDKKCSENRRKVVYRRESGKVNRLRVYLSNKLESQKIKNRVRYSMSKRVVGVVF